MISPSVRSRTLIGRDAELQLLRDTRRSLSNGRGGVVLVGGDAGIGKTRLLAEFTESLGGGRAPLYAFGECLEHAPSAFGPVRQVLESLVHSAPWATLAASPLARRTLRTLVPDALAAVGQGEEPGTVERAELFSGVLAYLAAIAAKRAVVIAIEDLHWADGASLELLGHLAGRIAGMRLMIVGTYRDLGLGAGHPLFAALTRLTRLPNVTSVSLEPLPSGDVAALVVDALSGNYELSSDRLRDLVARSEGNPLFAEELLKRAVLARKTEAKLPISIRGIILERLAGLDPAARLVLDHAALLGASFTTSLLALVLERDEESLAPVLERLRSFDLIVPDGAAIRFRHALTREAIYGELRVSDARPLHAKIALMLAALPDADDRLDDLAYHSLEGNLRVEALDFNERAGQRAMTLHAPAHAAKYFLRALELAGEGADVEVRVRLLERAGAATSQSCDFARSIEVFTQLYEMQLGRGNYDAAAVALLRAANDTANTNRGVEAMELLRAFLATNGARLSATASDHLISSLAYLATTQEAHDLVPTLLRNVREPEGMSPHPHQAYWLARLFTAERRIDLPAWLAAVEAIRIRLDEAYPLARGQLLHSIGQTALSFGQIDEAERALDEAIAYDGEHGLTHPLAFASAVKVRLLYLQGRLTEALPLIRFTLHSSDIVAVRSQLMMGASHVALALGDESLARECVDDELYINTSDGTQVLINAMMSSAMAAWLLHTGRGDRARRILDSAVDMLEQPFTEAKFWCMAATLVDPKNFGRLRDLCVRGARNEHDSVMHATLPMVEGLLAERAGDTAAARRFATIASERFGGLRWPLFEAAALELAGRREAALELYRACESVADLRRLEMGAPDTGSSAPAPSGLSRREREVAALVARGYTNRAIGEQLHISENTVEKHVSKIYMKLRFSTRSELAAYAARAGNLGLSASG